MNMKTTTKPTWRIATFKDSGRKYFVRGMTVDLERVTLWGELTSYRGFEDPDGTVRRLKVRCAEGFTVDRARVDVVERRPTADDLRHMMRQARAAARGSAS